MTDREQMALVMLWAVEAAEECLARLDREARMDAEAPEMRHRGLLSLILVGLMTKATYYGLPWKDVQQDADEIMAELKANDLTQTIH